jgi:hypothetical protein
VDPVPDPLLLRKSGSAHYRPPRPVTGTALLLFYVKSEVITAVVM